MVKLETTKFEIGVLGAGSWGTALALVAAHQGAKVRLWTHRSEQARAIERTRENTAYLQGAMIPENVFVTDQLSYLEKCQFLILAIPTQALANVANSLVEQIKTPRPLVLAAKGIAVQSQRFPSQIVAPLFPDWPILVLSGPSFAHDVARKLPTAVSLASSYGEAAEKVVAGLAAPWFRLYRNSDILGVEIGGATKNVIAIACGIAEGCDFGASAVAALATRGFAEVLRFGRAIGARQETMMGLSGLGDLMLTCSGPQSRNFNFGRALGKGATPPEKLAEGALTAPVLSAMAKQRGVDMPIVEAVADIVAQKISVQQAIAQLLARPPGRHEHH